MKHKLSLISAIALTISLLSVCSTGSDTNAQTSKEEGEETEVTAITFEEKVTELEDGLQAVRLEGNYGFEEYLSAGGASSDGEGNISITSSNPFGCSTISTQNVEGEYLFGRNFDWGTCNALIVQSKPTTTAVRILLNNAAGV